jgi:plastocyanin
MILAAGSIRAATIQIDGVIANGRVQWSVGGVQATSVAVNPGDTVIWRAVSARHGVVFDTQAAAEGVLQFQTDGGLPPLGPQNVRGETVWGTAPQDPAGPGTVLARATVKSGVAPNTRLGFFCSQHGRMMSGAIAVADGSPPPPPDGNPPSPPVPGKQLPAPG